MTCTQARQELSREMDGEVPSSPDGLARHLRDCRDCGDFRSAAAMVAAEYRRRVRSGIELLRRSEGGAPWEPGPVRRSRLRWRWAAVPLAAAGLLCWFGLDASRPADPIPDKPALAARPFPPSPRLRLIDDLFKHEDPEEDGPLVLGQDLFLPLRLEQDLLPARPEEAEVRLPSSLRF